MNNVCICVVGMHRSGTSALAGALAAAGVQFGADLLPAAADQNSKGFWEHREVVRVHDRLLGMLGSSWDDIRPLPPAWWEEKGVAGFRERLSEIVIRDFEHTPLWGMKDPRMCRLLPLWTKILDDLELKTVFVIPFRHPVEVARSLEKRDGFSAAKSGFLWLDHNLSAEFWSRGRIRLFVNFDNLIGRPGAIVRDILNMAGRSPNDPIEDRCARIEAAVVPELKHYAVDSMDWRAAFGEKGPLLAQCFQALSLSGEGHEDSEHATFDALRINRDELIAGLDEMAIGHMADLQSRVSKLEEAVERVRATPKRCLIALLRLLGVAARTKQQDI